MASKVDMSLDDLVQFSRKKGPGGGGKFNRPNQTGAQRTGKFQQLQNQGGGKGAVGAGVGAKVADLRDVLAKKQKSTVGDLRSKIKPKALYTSKYSSKSQPSTPQGPSSVTSPSFTRRPVHQPKRSQGISPMKPIRVDEPSSPVRSSRRSDPGPISHKQRSVPSKLPSYDEAKKITVTVPGTRHPPSSSEVSSKFSTSHLSSLSILPVKHALCCWGLCHVYTLVCTYNVHTG